MISTTTHETAPGRVLVVDDNARARESMADILRHLGHQAEVCGGAVEALNHLLEASADVIITDMRMPGMSGLEFVRALAERECDSQIIMVTAHATVATAVDAMRYGAFDYLEKPCDADQLEDVVVRALRRGRAGSVGSSVPPAPTGRAPVAMIGSSAGMRALRQRIAQIAPTQETVLISGESGTGKELVASSIHAASTRSQAALVGLNCPALSAQLMESELFGHEQGAFTSADSPRVGRFELADGGTILLDEVTEIEPPLQAKLLRVLQEKSFERVGSSATRQVDVRVLATTNRDLREEVLAGNFREDLYFRLAVVPLTVPPLRDRREDIPELLEYFRHQNGARLQADPVELAPAALDLLLNYRWPGNVRELENIVTRASVLNLGQPMTAEEIRPWLIGEVDDPVTPQASSLPVGMSLEQMERKLIEATLERFAGHRAKTAEALGIGIRTLTNKLRSYGYAPRTKEFAKAA